MPEDNLEQHVAGIVDRQMEAKLDKLRSEFQLELAPVRLQLRSHAKQMRELRKTSADTAEAVSHLEGVVEATEETRKSNHAETQGKMDAILEKLNNYLGRDQGREALENEQLEESDRRKQKFRDWAKLMFNASIIGAIYKGGRWAWEHLHHR